MILTLQQSVQLQDLRAYSISCASRLDEASPNVDPWEGRELLVTVTISGYGTSNDKSTPTWQASATDSDIGAAFARALTFAPAQREAADAIAAGRLGDILPEYDPDGSRFKKTKRSKSSSGKKLSADELAALLDLNL